MSKFLKKTFVFVTFGYTIFSYSMSNDMVFIRDKFNIFIILFCTCDFDLLSVLKFSLTVIYLLIESGDILDP